MDNIFILLLLAPLIVVFWKLCDLLKPSDAAAVAAAMLDMKLDLEPPVQEPQPCAGQSLQPSSQKGILE